ncbi:MAG: DUF4838 domain-containing protein [Candidatus Didemnitutus sp.]|nr:DUF4838 domain-containing protein [Candidatus Didemnitutus sp.]
MLRPSLPTFVLFVLLLAGLVAGGCLWREASTPAPHAWLVFHQRSVPRPLLLAAHADANERRAAQLLAETLAAAAGVPRAYFPIRRATASVATPGTIRLVAKSDATSAARPTAETLLQRGVGYEVNAAGLTLWANHRDDLPAAVAWFLAKELQARWFMPGRLGRELPRRSRFALPFGSASVTPGYFSRHLHGLRSPAEQNWFAANQLNNLVVHGHTASQLLTPADFQRDPRLAPEWNGERYLPQSKLDQSWQPDLTQTATSDLVSRALAKQFTKEPRRLAAAFGQNDNWRWDQSAATLAVNAPHRYFRRYPDYSNTLFAFLNRVAADLSPTFPDRFVSTYAYQWTENVPRFAVHPQVLPMLTADRSQWFDPAYAAEDQDLIRRWSLAGPRIFGIYDYYYGRPFLVPRPTLYAVSQSIPFAHAAGARAFFAECSPNWGLDGPKAWLAAQLLWNPAADSTQLLDDYYARFWREAEGPMREFFAICERQWLNQPKPAYWLRYFKDDHQRFLFPPSVRRELGTQLERAAALTRSAIVRERLALVRAAFTVTERFCHHDETRDALSRLALQPPAPTDELLRAFADFSAARRDLLAEHARVKRAYPLAIAGDLLGDYLRNDPRPRVLLELARRNVTGLVDDELRQRLFAGRTPGPRELTAAAPSLLADGGFATLRERRAHPFTLVDWNEGDSPWLGRSEPFERRRMELRAQTGGGQTIHFSDCNQEAVGQWLPVEAGALFHASVNVRGRVSPGNMTYLLVMFVDADGKFTDLGHIDRLPIGQWDEPTSLQLVVRAPANAVRLGFVVRALWQINDDYVEYSEASLRRLP